MQSWMTLKDKFNILVVCAPCMLLAGCGGSSPISEADKVGNGFDGALVCGLVQCAESNTLSINQIATYYTVTQNGSDVHIDAQMSNGSAVVSKLQLSPGDTLSAAIGSQTVSLVDISAGGLRIDYAADITNSQSQPTVTVSYSRNGVAYSSSVVVPAQFAILPSNVPVSVTLASGSYNVQLGIPASSALTLGASGICTRVDGSTFNAGTGVAFTYQGTVTGGTSYQVRTADLDSALNKVGQTQGSPANLSPVQTCNLQMTWVQSQNGTTPSAMSSNSGIVAQTSVTQQVFYNAQH